MEKKKISSVVALLIPFTALLLVLWLSIMCFLTILVAKNVQDDWEKNLDASVYGDFYGHFVTSETPAAADKKRIPLTEMLANKVADYGNDVGIAMAFFEDGQPATLSNYLGYIRAWKGESWYARNIEYGLNKPSALIEEHVISKLPTVRMDLNGFFDYDHPVLDQLLKDGYYGENGKYLRFTGYFWDKKPLFR